MQRFLLIFSVLLIVKCYGQSKYFDNYDQDTIHLHPIQLKRIVGLNVGEAVIGIDYQIFNKRLHDYRKGVQKKLRKRKTFKTDKIVAAQTKMYRKHLAALDSVYSIISNTKTDTVFLDFKIIQEAGSPFGDFLPKMIEGGQCLIFDKSMNRQSFIIRQKGWKKTGAMTSHGSTLYFLNGSERHFWSRWDFSS